ncbi:MAG: hypothetical protein ABIN95_09025 [Mucilaginibacter sp.]
MQTYKELLNSSKWKAKRKEIIEAYKLKCSMCNNATYTETSIRGRLKFMERIRKDFIGSGFTYNFKVTFKSANGVELYSTIHTYKDLNNTDLNRATVLYNSTEAIIINAIKLDAKWIYVRNLHVHHTYYQDGRLPWEYPDIALKVICWSCHEKLHKNETINWLDTNGNIKGELNPCPRCFGAGWFPEYVHVENGVCFECSGAKYIELI